MQTLSIFPPAVVKRAIDPVQGIPGVVKFLNLAEIRKHLDTWFDEHYQDLKRREFAARKQLPEPTADPQVQHRIAEGFKQLTETLKAGTLP